MARTRSTSKKRSAASSSRRKPPESLVFFIDRSLGRKKVPEALRAAGLDIRVHDELFPQATQDVVWLAFAQFDNDVRSDRTRAGMKAALELGRWVFLAPIGYLNAPRSIGKSLIHDPERAPLVRRAFEEYATGRFTKEQLLKQVRTWRLTNRRGRPLTSQAIGVLLRNRLYAGIVDVPEYGVRGKRGDFEPLVSEELFYRVQAI